MEAKKIKIEIKSRLAGKVLFEYEAVDNTIAKTLEAAVKSGAYLSGADLRRAYLSGADLRRAYLSGADLRRADLSGAYLRRAYLSGADLRRADLSGAYLNGADLSGADLSGADLRRAYLSGADLSGADLRRAYLSGAYLNGADLRRADLSGADLSGADLRGADLSGADLNGADLSGADLSGAYLNGAKDIPFVPFSCPSDGAFIGWKKVYDDETGKKNLVKLLIPQDAERCSATGRKCRCSKAQVLAIYDIGNNMAEMDSCTNRQYAETTYKVGCEVLPDKWDDNRWNECSNGIHFFINKQEAIDY